MAAPDEEWEGDGGFCALQSTVNEMLVRLEEVESILSTAKNQSDGSKIILQDILSKKNELYKLCKRIDDLEHFIDIVDNQLSLLGKQVEMAEDDLGISDNKLKSLFKNVFRKSRSEQGNLGKNYVPIEVFRTEDYFQTNCEK